MRVTVHIDGRTYEVEIEDLNKRPIIAIVDGERYEVAPATEFQPAPGNEPASTRSPAAPAGQAASNALLAPLPGTVTEIFVLPGASVQAGQPVCVIEAMKMKNTVHADRDGTIASVAVNPGQSVRHRQALVEFEA